MIPRRLSFRSEFTPVPSCCSEFTVYMNDTTRKYHTKRVAHAQISTIQDGVLILEATGSSCKRDTKLSSQVK